MPASPQAAELTLLNTDLAPGMPIDPRRLLTGIDGSFAPFTVGPEPAFAPGMTVSLAPGEMLVAAARGARAGTAGRARRRRGAAHGQRPAGGDRGGLALRG